MSRPVLPAPSYDKETAAAFNAIFDRVLRDNPELQKLVTTMSFRSFAFIHHNPSGRGASGTSFKILREEERYVSGNPGEPCAKTKDNHKCNNAARKGYKTCASHARKSRKHSAHQGGFTCPMRDLTAVESTPVPGGDLNAGGYSDYATPATHSIAQRRYRKKRR
eukprot:jgi/Mesvir1/12837/Mv22362-RA.1